MANDLKSWISGSFFRDASGSPKPWFHGTDITDPFNIFACCEESSLGFHFGTAAAANDRLAKISMDDGELAGNIIPVFCRASNPLILDDLYTWGQWSVASALRDCGILTDEEAEFVADSASAEMIYAALEEAGHDCVLYTNACESREDGEVSLMVWRAEMIKGIHSEVFEIDDPRILSQLPVLDHEGSWHASLASEIDRCRDNLRKYRQNCVETVSFRA